MLFEANLKKTYWAEAVATAAYIINRSPSRVLNEVTPYEKWSGKKPNISHLKIFGSKAMVHVPKQNRLKWDRKSRELLFMGYCENTKGYRVYDPVSKKMVISRDVIFIEKTEIAKNITPDPLSVPPFASITLSSKSDTLQDTIVQDSPQNISQNDTMTATCDTSFDSCNGADDPTYYPNTSDDDSTHDIQRNITLRSHQRRNMEGNNFMCVTQITDPLTVKEALLGTNAKEWKAAMDEEYKCLLENETWELTTLPANKHPKPCKWVFKTKTDENGQSVKYKARLVIKGRSQKIQNEGSWRVMLLLRNTCRKGKRKRHNLFRSK